jgi:hypothetical protein
MRCGDSAKYSGHIFLSDLAFRQTSPLLEFHVPHAAARRDRLVKVNFVM